MVAQHSRDGTVETGDMQTAGCAEECRSRSPGWWHEQQLAPDGPKRVGGGVDSSKGWHDGEDRRHGQRTL